MEGVARLLNLLFPPKCIFCRAVMTPGSDHRVPCPDCSSRLMPLPRDRQQVYASGLPCFAPLAYTGRTASALKDFKFHNRLSGVDYFAGLMYAAISGRTELDGLEVVTWTPLSARRWRRRGFNQSRLLAKALAKRMGLPCKGLLVRIRHATPQSHLGHDDHARFLNVRGSYSVRPFARPAGLRVLLVDDIVTSGATAAACASCLMSAGTKSVHVAAAALARPRR